MHKRLGGQLHTILEDMDRYPNSCLEELEAFMTLWDVKPRVEESSLETLSMDELITQLRKMCEDAEDHASNAQEEARHKRKEALEEVVQQITYQIIDAHQGSFASRVVKHAAAAVTHAASTQEENNLGSNSSQNKTCNYKEFRAVMHENFRGTEGAVGLTRWFEKLESQFRINNVAEGERVKFASSTLLDAGECFNPLTMERQDIRPKTTELHLIPQTKEDQEAKEDREAMSLVLDVVRKDTTRTSVQTMGIKAVGIKFEATRKTLRTIKGRIKGTLRGITKINQYSRRTQGTWHELNAMSFECGER
ncbi:hypothetical protein Tco_0115899 [Tanacetum coccineum]